MNKWLGIDNLFEDYIGGLLLTPAVMVFFFKARNSRFGFNWFNNIIKKNPITDESSKTFGNN